MSLTPLLDVLVTDPTVRGILTAPVGTGDAALQSLDIAVSAGARPPLIAALAGAQARQCPPPDPCGDRHRA